MNKYLLNIPPWLKKGAISAPNTAYSGIKKCDLEKICKAHNDCKDKIFYKNKTNDECHLCHRRREAIKDTLLIFEYPNLSLKNLKNNTCIENVALDENCFIQNTASHISKQYDSVLDAIAILQNSETNYDLIHKEDDHHDELLLDVGLLNCYLDNHNEQNLQPTTKISRTNEEPHITSIKVKNNMNSKNTDCLLVNFITFNGQEINIKIDLGNLWRELNDEKNQNLKNFANRTLSLNCYLSMLANKGKTGLDKYKTVLNLSKQPEVRHDLELNTRGLFEKESKIYCPANLKIASKDSSKLKDNAELNPHNFFKRASNATSCDTTISENCQMTFIDNDTMNNKSSKKEITNNNYKDNKISKISEAQNVEGTLGVPEYVNDKQHKEITSNTPQYELRNRIKQVKVKISDFFPTNSKAELSAISLTPSNIQKRKPQKVHIKETFVYSNLHSNSKLQSQSNDLGVELNKNKCAGLNLKKENLNRFDESISTKCVKVINETECMATNDKSIDSKGSAFVKIEDGKTLSKSNRNSNIAQNIEEIDVRSSCKIDQVDKSLSTALSKITHKDSHSVSNFNLKVAKEVEEGVTKAENSEERDYFDKNKNIGTLKTAGEKNILSVSSTHLTTSQKLEEEMKRTESSKKRNQGDENKCVAILKVDGSNVLSVPNYYSLPKQKIERARNDNFEITGQLKECMSTNLQNVQDENALFESNIGSKSGEKLEETINKAARINDSHQHKESKRSDVLKREYENNFESNNNTKVVQKVKDANDIIAILDKSSQLKKNTQAAHLNVKGANSFSRLDVCEKLDPKVDEVINRNETSDEIDQLKGNKSKVNLKVEDANKLCKSNVKAMIAAKIDEVISKIYISDKSGHFTENKRTAVLNVVDGKTPSTSNVVVKVSPKNEVMINITEISYRSGQLKINKKAAVVKVENEHTDSERQVTLKVVKIKDAIKRAKSPGKNKEFNEKKRVAFLKKAVEEAFSKSNVIAKVASKEEEAINRTEILDRNTQLKENLQLPLLKEEGTHPTSNVIAKEVPKIEEAINRTEIIDRNAQLKENMQLPLLKEDNTLSNSIVNEIVASKEEEAINRTEILDRTAQLKENMQLPLFKEEDTHPTSNVIAKMVPKIEEAINSTEILDRNAQFKENMQLTLFKEDNTLSNSKGNAIVASKEEEAIKRTEILDRNSQLKENMQLPLLKEDTLSKSNLNVNLASNDLASDRSEISDRRSPLMEKQAAIFNVEYDANTHSKTNVNPQVVPKVEGAINRTVILVKNVDLKHGVVFNVKNENTISESKVSARVASNAGNAINRIMGSTINDYKHEVLTKKNDVSSISELNTNFDAVQKHEALLNEIINFGFNESETRGKCDQLTGRKHTFCYPGDGNSLLESSNRSKIAMRVDEGITNTELVGKSDCPKESSYIVPLKSKNAIAISESNRNLNISKMVNKGITRSKQSPSICDMSIVTNSKSTLSKQKKLPIRVSIEPSPIKNKSQILKNYVLCHKKDNGSLVNKSGRTKGCVHSRNENLTDGENSQSYKATKDEISFLIDSLFQVNATKFKLSRCNGELMNNSYNPNQTAIGGGEISKTLLKNMSDNEKLVNVENNRINNNNCKKSSKPLICKKRTKVSIFDRKPRTPVVRKSFEQNIKKGIQSVSNLNTHCKYNNNAVKYDSRMKKSLLKCNNSNLYICADKGNKLFGKKKRNGRNSSSLSQLHTRTSEKVKEKEIFSNGHQKYSSNTLGEKSVQTTSIAPSPSCIVTRISGLPERKPIKINYDLMKGTTQNETAALKKNALDNPTSYSPFSPSPSRRSTKLAALQFIKNTLSSLKKKELNNKKESTQCNDNCNQSNKLKMLNCQKQDKENYNLNQSLLHTHHVKQVIFKCPKTQNVSEKGCSCMIAKLQNTIGAIAKLISSNVDSKKEQMESSTSSQERNKPTVCPSNTVMKMLQEKALNRRKNQVTQPTKTPKFCSLSYADILNAEVNRNNQTKNSS